MYSAIAGQNIRDCLDRIKGWLESGGKARLSERDMEVYGLIVESEKAVYGENRKAKPQMREITRSLNG